MDRHPLLVKIAALLLLVALLAIPLQLIGRKISERGNVQAETERELATSAFGAQTIAGPYVVLRCVETSVERGVPEHPCGTQYAFPDTLEITGTLPTDIRRRGIHEARVYHAALELAGTLNLPAPPPSDLGLARRWADAELVLGVGDLRGLKNQPVLRVAGSELPFGTGPRILDAAPSLAVALPVDRLTPGTVQPFALSLRLDGLGRLAITPMAGRIVATLRSPWPHPSFDGRFLPDARSVGADGFTATWTINRYAAGGEAAWSEALRATTRTDLPAFGVSFVAPVNLYLQSYRAAEYGLLVIGLTFALFLLFEAVRGWRIHPVQYGLIGMALAVFFLLLLALAEHVGFAYAYLIAATACVALLTAYAVAITGTRTRGAGCGAYFAALYGAIYLLLAAEDMALLLGSLLVFGVLALVMVATRNVDWSRPGGRSGDAGLAPDPASDPTPSPPAPAG